MQINLKYKILQKMFGFHKWHTTPAEQRPYSMEVIKWCNRLLKRNQKKILIKVLLRLAVD